MTDPCEAEMERLANRLHQQFRDEATITHDNSDRDDQYVYITPADDENPDVVLDRVERKLRKIAENQPETFLYKLRGDQLHVKIVEDDSTYNDSQWVWV